jgi:hypothetical protein
LVYIVRLTADSRENGKVLEFAAEEAAVFKAFLALFCGWRYNIIQTLPIHPQ